MGSVAVFINGGMGNQLFQLAALIHISRKTGRKGYIQTLKNPSPHSSVPYFDTIFREFRQLHASIKPTLFITEPSLSYVDWRPILYRKPNPEIHGYLQDWRYVDNDFIQHLWFPNDVTKKYENVKQGIFLHIRGGDYVGDPFHNIGLDAYYERAIAMFPGAHFFVVTNDHDYAMKRPFMANLNHTFVMESEIDTLYFMSQCAGGICANSSFSWWGAFLNPHRKIVMPDRWFSNPSPSIEGYYFPGVIKCQV